MMHLDLEPLEAAVLDMLLAGEHPVLVALRRQLSGVTTTHRELTGVGFFLRFSLPEDARPAGVSTLHIGDVEATVHGLQNGAGFVLFVNGGLLTMLAGFSYDERWPHEVTAFAVRYHEPSRAKLAGQLG